MGADTFMITVSGKTAEAAFASALAAARYMNGHGGYTGTIAEKQSFVMIDVPRGEDARAYARKLIDDADVRIDDKWGPAGCIKLGAGKDDSQFLFFGWASS